MDWHRIKPIKETFFYPASMIQKRIWIGQSMALGASFFNISRIKHIKGRLNEDLLHQSLVRLADRHDMLSARFVMTSEGLKYSFQPRSKPDYKRIDISARKKELASILEAESNAGFDLGNDLLARFRLFKIGKEEYYLIYTFHHLICDRRSVDMAWRDWMGIYQDLKTGRGDREESPFPSYHSYALWENKNFDHKEMRRQYRYWQKQMGSELPIMELRNSRPLNNKREYKAGMEQLRIPAQLEKSIKEYGIRKSITWSTFCLSGLFILLDRMTESEKIFIGTWLDRRWHTDWQRALGPFLGSGILSMDMMDGELSIDELLERTRDMSIDLTANSDLTFDHYLEKGEFGPLAKQAPFFNVIFQLMKKEDEPRIPGLKIEALDAVLRYTQFDLRFLFVSEKKGIRLKIVYSRDRFGHNFIKSLRDAYLSVLSQMLDRHSDPVKEISLLPPRQEKGLIKDFLDIPRISGQADLWKRFSRIASAHPLRTAIEGADYRIKYRELENNAWYLADALFKDGPNRDICIIALKKGAEFALAMLAGLAAGKTIVPLDPDLPMAYFRKLCASLPPGYLVTDRGFRARLLRQSEKDAGMNISLMPVWPFPEKQSERKRYAKNNNAYIAFSSGTLGDPKPFVADQKSICRYLDWEIGKLQLRPGVRCGLLSPLGFTVLMRDFFAPLLGGATLCIPGSGEKIPDIKKIALWIKKNKINVIHTIPTFIRLAVASDIESDWLDTLRHISLSGESWEVNEIERKWLLKRPSQMRIYNLYGQAETVQAKLFSEIKNEDVKGGCLPLGHPLPGNKAIIKDRYGHPVPPEWVGELYLNSDCLAERLSAPFPDNMRTQKLVLPDQGYATGDIGFQNKQKRFFLTGRRDGAIDIFGININTDYLERVINSIMGAIQCRVVRKADDSGQDILVVFYQYHRKIKSSEFRKKLIQAIPGYMIPNMYVRIGKSRTPLAKIRSWQLDHKGKESAEKNTGKIGLDAISKAMINIWQEILENKSIKPRDNFFELGGHSLKATRLVAAISQRWNIEMPLRHVFEQPTPGQLADIVRDMIMGREKL